MRTSTFQSDPRKRPTSGNARESQEATVPAQAPVADTALTGDAASGGGDAGAIVWPELRGRRLLRLMEELRPRNREELRRFVQRVLGLCVPDTARVDGNDAPLDYLCHAFFEEEGDVVVWAARGSGKTMLGAVATLLDLVFKPGVQVRILGGSLEQSSRMYRYLTQMMDHPLLRGMLAGPMGKEGFSLIHGSTVHALPQSQRAVRGLRVQKLRCDEVELFDPEVWRAAQLTTQSRQCGGTWVHGRIEALSTMHLPGGLMRELTRDSSQRRVMRWSVVDVLERCPPERACEPCALWQGCGGRAKTGEGYVGIDDAVDQRQRSSDEAWESEMLCLMPRRDAMVYPTFGVVRHVFADAGLCDAVGVTWVGGMDFGMRQPLVMLLARLREVEDAGTKRTVVEVVDEYADTGRTLPSHLDAIEALRWPGVQWIGVDPAGAGHNAHTGLRDIDVLRQRGYRVRYRGSRLREGIECVRRHLDQGTLRIASRCVKLIDAMGMYHFDPLNPLAQEPVKDGPDHWCDALRYMLINMARRGDVGGRAWI